MSQTIIPQSSKQYNPGKNQKYVNSRQGGPMEQSRSKQASIKHHNPEYFKRQSDRKKDEGYGNDNKHSLHKDISNENIGRGVGCIGAYERDKKQKGEHMHPHKGTKDKGQDVGRGVGEVGRDSKKKR